MKTVILLSFFFCLSVGCKKVEITNVTGTLKVQCKIDQKDYENISFMIFPTDSPNSILFYGHPDGNGVYVQELLQGNYNIEANYLDHSPANFSIQVVGGKTSEKSIQW